MFVRYDDGGIEAKLTDMRAKIKRIEAERDGYLEALNGSQRDLLAVMDERDEARRWARRLKRIADTLADEINNFETELEDYRGF